MSTRFPKKIPVRRCAIGCAFCCALFLLVSIAVAQNDQPQTIVGQDGAEMVLIPATQFLMGTNASELDAIVTALSQYSVGRPIQRYWFDDETPQHNILLDAYYIDKYEVTNAQYRKFMEATGYPEPAYWRDARFNDSSQPVVGVSWDDAMAYAQWAAKRLPTEAEWEHAARGGLVEQRYPWGDRWPPPPNAGNFRDASIEGYTDGYSYTSPVGNFNPNGYGLYDMVGNVAEWCLDAYSETYYDASPKQNPLNIPKQDVRVLRVVRGGGWSGTAIQLRCAYRARDIPSNKYNLVGFRCVLPAGRKVKRTPQSFEKDASKETQQRKKGETAPSPPEAPTINKRNSVKKEKHQSKTGFTDVTEMAGIPFRHIAGLSERKHLIETMGSGAVFL